MAVPPGKKDTGQSNEREAFVQQLSTRVAAIEEIWAKLESGQ